MAPANIKKSGSAFDLAIAIGILNASGQLRLDNLKDFLIMGELALDGSVRNINGALPLIIHAKQMGLKGCILPYDSALEGREVEGISIFGIKNLDEAINVLSTPDTSVDYIVDKDTIVPKLAGASANISYDFKNVRGQEGVVKGLERAAAGGHNVILIGSPGAGKTLMAKCFSTILPTMTLDESLEVSKIYSVAGLLSFEKGLIKKRPFRSPHHSSSIYSLAGAGLNAMPGEISLAHKGVLFLDEFGEFSRSAIEILRQPLEDREINICRANFRVCYPASFILIAAMNPCPCGYLYENNGKCKCSSSAIMRYSAKISGPILDRIDIQLNVAPVTADVITGCGNFNQESSETIALRVESARDIQNYRYKKESFSTNAEIPPPLLDKYCKIGDNERIYLRDMINKCGISARGYSRILKISRTIADLNSEDFISLAHICKAFQFRIFTDGICNENL